MWRPALADGCGKRARPRPSSGSACVAATLQIRTWRWKPTYETPFLCGYTGQSVLVLTDDEMGLFDHLDGTPSWNRGNWSEPDDPGGTWVVAALPFGEHILRMSLDVLEQLLAHIVDELPVADGRSRTPRLVVPEEDGRRLAALVGLDGLTAT